ncbi:MAG: hypothetical protein J6Q38_01035 [Clostridia bacterium]|nr:hypothetical protein [Clostridia bacterium]
MNKLNENLLIKNMESDVISSVFEDYERRRQERLFLEKQWILNLNYLAGNQYCEIGLTGEVKEEEKYYGWQSRSVFNHIAPIIDTRLAKLSRVRPTMSVRASGSEDRDLKTAEISSEILNSTYQRISLDNTIKKATVWSESLGTAFYKITWNDKKGKLLGKKDGDEIKEGDVEITAVSPFEIFPDSIFKSEIEDLKSLIYSRAVDVNEIEEIYGKTVAGSDIDVFSLTSSDNSHLYNNSQKKVSTTLKNHALVIEKYIAPNKNYPNGRLIIVTKDALLFDGELPYKNGVDCKRTFPFVKQTALVRAGSFFGESLIERLIPLQRAYNAVKNRKYEFMNRMSMGVINVEDGSIDTEELQDEGLSPGKIIVYRQGARPPQIMSSGGIPADFTYEEERLSKEFVTISGTSEISRSYDTTYSTMSGAALELLIEQDETRLLVTAESIRNAVKEVAKQILRIFKQFATSKRIMKSAGSGKLVKNFYFTSSDVSSDDVIFDTENEIAQTPAQKKTAMIEMLKTGLLSDDNGIVSLRTKGKILDILGYGSLDNAQDVVNLHRNKADKENIELMDKYISVDEYDNHLVHLEEHLRKILEEDVNCNSNKNYKEKLKKHYQEHKNRILKAEVNEELEKLNGIK